MQAIGQNGLIDIISDIRLLSDNQSSSTVSPVYSDAQITRMVQRHASKLYYMLVETGVPYSSEKLEFSLTNPLDGDVPVYELPNNFYQPLALFYKLGGDDTYVLISSGQIRSASSGYLTANGIGFDVSEDKQYIIIDRSNASELHIIPSDNQDGEYLLEYIPDAPDVIHLRVPRGWADYLIYASSLELCGSDFNAELAREWREAKKMVEKDILRWSSNRSPNETSKIQQIQVADLTVEQINNNIISGFVGDTTRIS